MTEALTTAQRLRVLALSGPENVVLTMTPDQALQMASRLELADQADATVGLATEAARAVVDEHLVKVTALTGAANWRMDRIEEQLLTRFWWWGLALCLGWAVLLA